MSDSDAANVAGSEGRLRPPFSHDWETFLADDFADALSAWRDGHDWSDAEAARQLRVPYNTFRQWITRRRACTLEATVRRTMTLIDRLEPAP